MFRMIYNRTCEKKLMNMFRKIYNEHVGKSY